MSRFRRRLMGLAALRQAKADDFVRVEYLENISNAYINVGIKGYNSISIDTQLEFTVKDKIQFFYGNRNKNSGTANSNYGYTYAINAGNGFATNVNTTVVNYPNYQIETDLKYRIQGTARNTTVSYMGIDEETQETVEKSFTFTNSGSNSGTYSKVSYFLNINGQTFNNDYATLAKVYYLKIYQNGTLVRDFIPMYQISKDTYGLWDRVTEEFYTSPNGVKFSGGARVVADANDNLYYIKNYIYINSTQTQYIILKPFTNTDNVELKVHPIGNTNYWFGDRTGTGTSRRLQIASWGNTRLDIAYGTQFPSITYSSGINNKDLILKLYDKKFYVNNQLLYTFTSTFNTTNNTNLGRVYNTGRATNSRFFWFKWWNGNKDLVYDLIPVQRCSDGVWGFFDKVSLAFHSSDGTAQFTGG